MFYLQQCDYVTIEHRKYKINRETGMKVFLTCLRYTEPGKTPGLFYHVEVH